jgi:hypothetical protein
MADVSGLTDRHNILAGNVIGLPTHPEYNNYLQHWKFLIRSYLGSNEYKKGAYLKRYIYETETEYLTRLDHAVVDNHVKAVTHIYNSFLYRQKPKRDFGSLEYAPEIEQFLDDADLEGRTWDSFMRDVNIFSTIYGAVWVLVDRPETVVGTRAEELQQNIRPFVSLYTPENVLDWKYVRQSNGHYELAYIKFLEQEDRPSHYSNEYYIRTWTPENITLEIHRPNQQDTLELVEVKPNLLGKVPAVCVYANRGPIKGIGVSDIADVAHAQRFLHECYSEAEQLISLTNHPTLVKTKGVDASAGAGAIISLPEDLDPNLKPYLLQPDGGNLSAILSTIQETIQAIDKMAHLGAIRAIETRQMSGVAMQSEFLLLDAKLSEKARQLELAEEHIFRLFTLWQGQPFDGDIKYAMAFHIRDKNLDMDIIQKAAVAQRDSAGATPKVKSLIDQKIIELLGGEDYEDEQMEHPTTTTATKTPHIQEMIMGGYTDTQILQLHPEITQTDIDSAKQELLNSNNQ